MEAARLEDDEPLRQWLMVNPPQPLGPPHVDPALPQLSGLERAAEVLRYTAQCTEHWLSPHGTLREWFRRNLRLAFAVVIPLLVMAPVVTLLFDQLRGWSASALDIATNLARMPAVTFTMLLSAAGVFLYRWLLR
ncbi:MAG: hypothetical protein JWO08_1475 [Verrucomicrobiaceae bacterium]|nr:hypothetical protein [Verrucomicrobiaceae bacterium]